MTEAEKKALALLNAVCAEWEVSPATEDDMDGSACFAALTRAIEQHEAFKREVSDAVEKLLAWPSIRSQGIIVDSVAPFIIAKPDPLVDAMNESLDRLGAFDAEEADNLRAAIEARGGRIVWEGE